MYSWHSVWVPSIPPHVWLLPRLPANQPLALLPVAPTHLPAAGSCPYGITCRWASKHSNPDALTRQYVTPSSSAQRAGGEEGAPAQEAQPAAGAEQQAAGQAQQQAGSEQQQQAPTEQQQGAEEAEAGAGWWRRDGSIPRGVLELPVSAAPPQEALNTLSKELQLRLRCAAEGRRGRGQRWRARVAGLPPGARASGACRRAPSAILPSGVCRPPSNFAAAR